MDIKILNLFPATIVVSIERANEFEHVRENESSGNARENQTSWREERRQSAVSTRKRNFRSIHVTPGRIVNFIQCLTLLVGPLDSTVKYLNKLTWPRAETKKKSFHVDHLSKSLKITTYRLSNMDNAVELGSSILSSSISERLPIVRESFFQKMYPSMDLLKRHICGISKVSLKKETVP